MRRVIPRCAQVTYDRSDVDTLYHHCRKVSVWSRISCFWYYILNHADTAIPELVLSLTSTAIGGWALFSPTDEVGSLFHDQYIDVFLFMAGLAQFSMLWVPRRPTRVAALVGAIANLGIGTIWVMVTTFVVTAFPISVGSIAICGLTALAIIIFLRTDFRKIMLR